MCFADDVIGEKIFDDFHMKSKVQEIGIGRFIIRNMDTVLFDLERKMPVSELKADSTHFLHTCYRNTDELGKLQLNSVNLFSVE